MNTISAANYSHHFHHNIFGSKPEDESSKSGLLGRSQKHIGRKDYFKRFDEFYENKDIKLKNENFQSKA
jgi:hypothetical protein